MEYALMPKEDYVAACDAVRQRSNTTDKIKSGKLADSITTLYDKALKQEIVTITNTDFMNPTVCNFVSEEEHELYLKLEDTQRKNFDIFDENFRWATTTEEGGSIEIKGNQDGSLNFAVSEELLGNEYVIISADINPSYIPQFKVGQYYSWENPSVYENAIFYLEYKDAQGNKYRLGCNDYLGIEKHYILWEEGNSFVSLNVLLWRNEKNFSTKRRLLQGLDFLTYDYLQVRIHHNNGEDDWLNPSDSTNWINYDVDKDGVIKGVMSSSPSFAMVILSLPQTSSLALTVKYNAKDRGNIYEAGKQAENDWFWDIYQDNGNRERYEYTFSGEGWTSETFKPKYNMRPSHGHYMFHRFAFNEDTPIDLVVLLEKCGVTLDFSKVFVTSNAFQEANIDHLGVIDFSKAQNLNFMFNNSKIQKIDKLIVGSTGYQNFANCFVGCTYLTEIVEIEGIIGQPIDFRSSPVTVKTMKNVIACLKNFTGTVNEGKYTLTFSSACWEALEASGTSPDGGTWEEYVNNLGWLT